MCYEGTGKDEFGNSVLTRIPHHTSHSYPIVAAQIDVNHDAGIDVEQPKEKLRTIAHRVFSADEIKDAGNDLVKLCIYWSAKEALYKFHGKRQLLFTDHLEVDPFKMSSEGRLDGRIKLSEGDIAVALGYLVSKDFVVVFTQPNP